MEKKGYVVKTSAEKVFIRINRESACGGNCSHCKGCGTNELIIEADNDLNLTQGEVVKVIMDNSSFLKNSFFGYGLLAISIIIGTVIGFAFFKNELIALLFLCLFLFVALLLLKVLFKNRSTDIKIQRY